jgi:hypothetical protein
MRKPLVALTAVVAFAIAAPVAAPQANPQPNENASCIAHFIGPLGTPGSGRREVHGRFEFPWGQLISHFAAEHEGGSFEECATEQ